MTKRSAIRCPLDWSVLIPLEKRPDFITSQFHVKHHAIITYAADPFLLEKFFHHRFTSETFADDAGKEHAFVSIVISQCEPLQQSRLQRWIDPGPYGCVNYRCMVQDKVFWRRSSWQFGTFVKSLYYCRLPRQVHGLPMYNAKVDLDVEFDQTKSRYSKFNIDCRGEGGVGPLRLQLRDTGVPVLQAPPFEGFDSNESMLAALVFPTEYITRGEGNWVYRQPTQCTPFHPTVGVLEGTPQVGFLTETLQIGVDLSKPPHSVLLQDVVEDVQALQIEAHVEDENEPHSGTLSGVSGVNDRIQRKAMNRNISFRDGIRDKVYTEAGKSLK